MSAPRLDLAGERFGRLTAIRPIGPNAYRKIVWEFVCDCGETRITEATKAKSGRVQSCGCLNKEILAKNQIKGTRAGSESPHFKHGKWRTQAYTSWAGMKYRCSSPTCGEWPNYGGRGITVCDRWLDFQNFLEDMGERPDWATGGIDRIDVDGNYEPGNCRWATKEQQAQNKRPKGSSDL